MFGVHLVKRCYAISQRSKWRDRRMLYQLSPKFGFFVVLSALFCLVYLALNESARTLVFFQDVNDTQTYRPPPSNYFRVVSRGTNIQAGDLELHITTAVRYEDFPARHGFNVFLNGWVRENSDKEFKCCLVYSLNANKSSVVDVKAYTYHVYSQWIVDMQNGEFSCSLSKDQLASNAISGDFSYVTFAQNSCLDAPPSVLAIERPDTIGNSVGVCLKISYGSLNPELIVEWFEYVKLLGVTRVCTFLADDLEDDARRVFMYYKSTGFLHADPIHPAKSKNGTERGFRLPRYEEQAWVDEVMAANDCKHRMSGFDYVMVMDIDEFIVPRRANGTFLSILKETTKRYPTAGAFSFDSHVIALDWTESRKSPLHVMSKIVRSTFVNFDGADRNTRWAFKPRRTFFAQNNKAWPRQPYISVNVPHELYLLVHRRRCKVTWTGCPQTRRKVADPLILKYEASLLSAVKQLPLGKILPGEHTDYIKNIRTWKMEE